MSAQHTPGPWHSNPKDAEDSFFSDVNILRQDGLAVAVAVHNGDIEPETVAANAHLIAAAPELLEALEALMPSNLGALPATMPDSATLPLDISFGELRRARAAIAKARGQA